MSCRRKPEAAPFAGGAGFNSMQGRWVPVFAGMTESTESTRDDGVEALYEGMNGWRILNAKWQTLPYGTKKSIELVFLPNYLGHWTQVTNLPYRRRIAQFDTPIFRVGPVPLFAKRKLRLPYMPRRACTTASVTSWVVAVPPKSGVRTPPLAVTASMAFMTSSPASCSPR